VTSALSQLVTAVQPKGASRVITRGVGECNAPNAESDGSDDPEGRARNRREEIVVFKGA